jgi:hypothetical protein
MYYPKSNNAQVVFKSMLLAVYFAFFSVQLLLRFDASLSRQSLDTESYKSHADRERTMASVELQGKNKCLSYLNKRFHPKDALFAPALADQLDLVHSPCTEKCYWTEPYISVLKIDRPSFRGPPTC